MPPEHKLDKLRENVGGIVHVRYIIPTYESAMHANGILAEVTHKGIKVDYTDEELARAVARIESMRETLRPEDTTPIEPIKGWRYTFHIEDGGGIEWVRLEKDNPKSTIYEDKSVVLPEPREGGLYTAQYVLKIEWIGRPIEVVYVGPDGNMRRLTGKLSSFDIDKVTVGEETVSFFAYPGGISRITVTSESRDSLITYFNARSNVLRY